MITLKEFLECIDYKITEGDRYGWDCYGPNARQLDYWNGKHEDGVSINVIFDASNQTVYEMQAWDYYANNSYRWIHPDYIDALKDEHKRRNVPTDFGETYDKHKFIDLELPEDILEKARAIFLGEKYDTRIKIQLTLDDAEMLLLMTRAHEADMTLNDYVNHILQNFIDNQTPDISAEIDNDDQF